jgi:NAD(P)-dependent dehydrogenase (short-subunit alcohol dehydrogenase family)
MTQTDRAILITGANSGIGKEIARQLALRGEFSTIFLACRNRARADAAKSELERATRKSSFRIVEMDVSDPDSVRSAIDTMTQPLHTVVCNAGGIGGPKPLALTDQGVTEIFAANVLGHVILLEGLIERGALTAAAVLTGSEAARGVTQLRIPRPTFTHHSVDEFASVIDGSFYLDRRSQPMLAYGHVKYLAALWVSALARRQSSLRLVTVSPGNTAGTRALEHAGPLTRTVVSRVVMPYIAPVFGLAHKLDVGAGRLVDAIVDDSYRSGVFYASRRNALTGPVRDQAEILADFADLTVQDRADQAIHRFVDATR